ncbi:MAG: hybrid sensor histidine kinase/response regulator [Gammaproteobacteria bacterium]|nr:hybrid sensor histidine kinase/response regulator [Gammaproteobacteria bacterium]
MSGGDAFLLGLFREELSNHSAVLTEGLLTLERGDGSPQAIEPLMRAAHSIKGAARVVDLDAIVSMAHVMEDILVAAGGGDLKMDAVGTDLLLGALDWMVGAAQTDDDALFAWMTAHADEAAQWVDRLGQYFRDNKASKAPSVESSPLPAPQVNVAVLSPGPLDPPEPEHSAPVQEPNDPPIRIAAETLSQILAFSADLLLESRRLEHLCRGLQPLKRLQRSLKTQLPAQSRDASLLEQGLHEQWQVMEQHDASLQHLSSRMNFLADRLHNLALQGRMRPFSEGIQGFPRLVRDLARQLEKSVELDIEGSQTLIDRDILTRLDAPINHLLRNALDHGFESAEERKASGKAPTGQLRLSARHRSGRLLIAISDDGRGIDAEMLRRKIVQKGLVTEAMAEALSDAELFDFLFLPGLTTRDTVSEISGRGVGLDVVQSMVHASGGAINVTSKPGLGTRFELLLPVTRSVMRTLRVTIAGQAFALPLSRIDRAERLDAQCVECLEGLYYFAAAEGNVALVSARRLLGLSEEDRDGHEGVLPLVLFSSEGRQYAMEVEQLVGETDLVVRPLDRRLGKVPHINAVALDAEGYPVLILDVEDLIRTADRLSGQAQRPKRRTSLATQRKIPRILVVDDSLTVREVERKLLENGGYEVAVAVDGVDGWNQLIEQSFDLVVTDVDMPRMNGIELVTRIRAEPRLEELPVIIVSYKDREEDRQRGMQAGADSYLTKSSFHDAGLIDAVRDLIGAGRPS